MHVVTRLEVLIVLLVLIALLILTVNAYLEIKKLIRRNKILEQALDFAVDLSKDSPHKCKNCIYADSQFCNKEDCRSRLLEYSEYAYKAQNGEKL